MARHLLKNKGDSFEVEFGNIKCLINVFILDKGEMNEKVQGNVMVNCHLFGDSIWEYTPYGG